MNWKVNWDALGVGASLACAIHCAVLPLILTSLPVCIDNYLYQIGKLVRINGKTAQ